MPAEPRPAEQIPAERDSGETRPSAPHRAHASSHDPFWARLSPGEPVPRRAPSEAELLSTLQLAHELRSPLASIQSALDMLLQGYARNNPELHDEMLSLARDRAVVMLGQVNDFLRLGAVQHSEVERQVRPVQLLDVLKRLVPEKEVRAKWQAVELRLDLPDVLPTVDATPEDMEHLLSNLINNAIKYTKPGGSVTISLRAAGDQVVGSVQDTGIGIASDDLARIFEEFYRTEAAKEMDAHGTGLGLSIVKRIVDLYGGSLDVESEVGQGSSFCFAFPRTHRPQVRETLAAPPLARRIEAEYVPAAVAARPARTAGREQIRTFHHLHREVISVGLCSKCGGCVSFCSAGALNALEMGGPSQGSGQGLPRYANRKNCLACGICYMICPATSDLEGELQETFGWRAPIGVYRAVRSARALDETVHASATDGGVVTALLVYLLEKRLIDGAIVSRMPELTTASGPPGQPPAPLPLIATTREELVAAAGSHFGRSSERAALEELSSQFTTYSPTLSAVKGLTSDSRRHLQRVAMVGTPCQIRTVKKMQCLGVLPAHVILYTIGLFCMESFDFNAAGRRRLEQRMAARLGRSVRFDQIEKLNVKEDMIVSLRDGATVYVPFDELEEIARPACLACTDFGNDYADLSAGGLGSPAGYTTVLIRTPRGSRIYAEALRQGYIGELKFGDREQARGKQADIVDQVVQFAQRKHERGEAQRRKLEAAAAETAAAIAGTK